MPRSSRHKSRRSQKRDGGARSDSEDEEPAARVSRDPARRSAAEKRRERVEEALPPDRWNGGEGDDRADEKLPRSEEFGPLDVEKSARSKLSAGDARSRSSRRREASVERDSGRRESSGGQYKELKERERERARGSERDSKKERLKRDDGERKKDGESAEWEIEDELRNPELEKELEKRTRKRREGSGDKDKWFADSKESDGKRLLSRDDHSKGGSYNDEKHKEGMYKDKYREDLDKDQRNRDEHALRDDRDQRYRDKRASRDDRDQRHRDERPTRDDWDQRHRDEHSSKDDRDQRHRDERSSRDDRDQRHREDHYLRDETDQRHRDDHTFRDDRDQRRHDEKHRDDGSSRDRTSDRSDSKHFREERIPLESYKKSNYHGSDHDGGPYLDDHITRYKDSRGRKRFSEVNDDQSDLRPRSAKEPREDVNRTALSISKFENNAVRSRLEYRHSDKVDPNLSSNQPKTSPGSNAQVKDQSRRISKPAESTHRGSSSEERLRISTSSTGDHARISAVWGRPSETQSLVKTKAKEDMYAGELLLGTAASSHYDRNSRFGSHNSDLMAEKTNSMSHRRLSDTTAVRHNLDIEEVGQDSRCKDAVDCSTTKDSPERMIMDIPSQAGLLNTEDLPFGSSSFKQMSSHFASNSPSHLPPPPVRHGIGSPSVLGAYEDDSRVQSGERRSNGRYKRHGDLSLGRGQGNVWKNTPTWPSPVANGFIPLQHDLTGFHPNVQQFSAPSLFGVRPSMDLNQTVFPYHVHATADRFPLRGRPFGWRSPADDSCPSPHLQPWDGGNSMYGDEPHVYAKPEWNHSKPLMGSRGWEMKAEMWRGPDVNVNTELSASQKESEYSAQSLSNDAWGGPSGHRLHNERARSESLHAESSGVEWPNDMSPATNSIEPSPKKKPHGMGCGPIKATSALEPSKTLINDDAHFFCTYLSKLDISLDLVYPELYKQCMILLEKRDVTDGHDASKQEQPQENKEEVGLASNSSNYIINSFFSTASDAIFQRAISLYKKQSEGTKLKVRGALGVDTREEKSPPRAYDVKAMAVDADTNSGDASVGNANPSSEEGSNAVFNVDAGLPDDSKESDLITDATVFVEGSPSQSCEALIPECTVNLRRRPNSPESTH